VAGLQQVNLINNQAPSFLPNTWGRYVIVNVGEQRCDRRRECLCLSRWRVLRHHGFNRLPSLSVELNALADHWSPILAALGDPLPAIS
jgi:hypothetical protein